MFFNVSFKYSDSVYCSNIAVADSENDVAAHYGRKYSWHAISPANECDVRDAQRRGKPIVKCAPAPVDSKTTRKLF